MSEYRYKLDPSSKKVTCPSCGKRRAVQYLDTETTQPLPEKYAKCDRAENCAYHLSPYTDGYAKEHSINEYKPVKMPEIKSELVTIPNEYVTASIGARTNQKEKNTLYLYMTSFIDKNKVDEAFDTFKIGTVKHKFWFGKGIETGYLEGCIIFWLMNEHGHAQGGEVAYVDAATGSTHKHEGNRCTRAVWTHYDVKERSKSDGPAEWILKFKDQNQGVVVNKKPHLFGLNQLKDKPLRKPIAIAEAPKTAIIASCFYPDFTWMASTSLSGLTKEKLEPLRDHRIVLYPDKGSAFKKWKSKSIELSNDGFMIQTSKILEKMECLNDGDDLADMLTPQFLKPIKPTVVPDPINNRSTVQSDIEF